MTETTDKPEPRNMRLTAYLTDSEYQVLRRMAYEQRLSVSALAGQVILAVIRENKGAGT
jgi:hypothetical protein